MERQDAFQGPWNAKLTEDWNRPARWDDYYRGLLAEADSRRREHVVHQGVELLIRMLGEAGELPPSSPRTLLDAGCGASLVPHVLAYLGFQVTAIDSSPRAIEAASPERPDEEELARCVPIWDPCEFVPGWRKLVEDPDRSLQRLRSFQAPGGSVSHRLTDWFAADLQPETFGVVHCRNALRGSTKPYWRRSLRRFHELLAPGGALLLENLNAIAARDEVEELLAEQGFLPLPDDHAREPIAKYAVGKWPTG